MECYLLNEDKTQIDTILPRIRPWQLGIDMNHVSVISAHLWLTTSTQEMRINLEVSFCVVGAKNGRNYVASQGVGFKGHFT